MDINTLWFALVTVLFVGYFFLEGFDYGVGILLPFLGRDDAERRVIINTIGPVWDGNEVWLLTAAGAMFAAFPHWYATLFSGFYGALVLMLLALIVRAVAFEFRSKDARPAWRNFWDWMIFAGSLLPAVLWGVALSNIVLGVPIDAKMSYVGGFWNLLNPYALLGGLVFLVLFTLHGALFLGLKTTGEVMERAHALASSPWMAVAAIVPLVAMSIATEAWGGPGTDLAFAALTVVVACWLMVPRHYGWAFIANSLAVVLLVLALFVGLYPRVMVSSLNPAWSLTIYNAASSPYTLSVMSVVALIFVPLVLLYQGCSYWIFRHRIGREQFEGTTQSG
ncbi:MAG: cytochrome d ubiquinol oxidase subunit II [Thermoflexales bacterium]|nr:cytochrome d ubiquinol oxidase subunit II [Thermoflexales bacterium]